MAIFGNDDCDRPACDDIKKNLPKSMEEMTAMVQKHKEKEKQKQQQAVAAACPLRSAELGRSSWKLLHSMAAWYPENPTVQQQEKMTQFMQGLAEFYPCTWCAQDFQENVKQTPVAAESRTDLCMWLCDQHNRVNQKLGKPLFDCNMKNLDERWRKSSNPKCQSDH